MNKHTDTIIINGQHFNARTGLPLPADVSATKTVRNVDGILPKHVTGATLNLPTQYTQPMKSVVKKPVMDMTRLPAPHTSKHPQQPGQTLMRRALAKPTPSLKRQTKLATANPKKSKVSVANLHRKSSAAVVDERKLQHAQAITKHDLIKRYAFPVTSVKSRPQLSPVAAQAVLASQQSANGLAKQPSMDLFEKALARADGHLQQPPKASRSNLSRAKKRQRSLNIATAAVACLLLIAFVAFQNVPNVKLQYASNRAGFHAALPGYKPAGFSVGKLSYQAGAVSVSFKSNSDSRAFAITQKPSAWDSQTLREDFVSVLGQQYHTASAGGRTIYLYGQNNATWVNDGVWYQVKTAGSLTERQLMQLASSM